MLRLIFSKGDEPSDVNESCASSSTTESISECKESELKELCNQLKNTEERLMKWEQTVVGCMIIALCSLHCAL